MIKTNTETVRGILAEFPNLLHEKASGCKIFGQEKNLATSIIYRIPFFLYEYENQHPEDDTILNTQFYDGGKLRTLDYTLANLLYTIKQWNRAAFTG
jgi:type I restriction enzyme M protein